MVAEPGEPLTEREREILRLVATGVANKEVARRLGISPNTVKVHLRNIFTKLGAESRTEATMIAVREGWVALPEVRPGAGPETAPEAPLARATEPPLPWPQRMALVTAAVLSMGAAVLAWPRAEPSASAPTGLLPVHGGRVGTQILLPEGSSYWAETAQMPSRRAWLGLAAWEGRLYAVGGEGPDGVTGAVEVYDPASDTWTRAAPKPTPVAYIGGATLGDRIVVPGGCTGDGTPLDVVEVYDPTTDVWETAAPLPQPLCGYAWAVYDENLYLFGGTDGQEYLATTYVYRPQEDRWREGVPMPQAQALAAATALGERIYVVGGYRARQEMSTCAVYDPATESWARCTGLTMARGGLGLVALGGQLYAIGGGGWGTYLGFNERYDPGGDRWTAVETPLMGTWQGAGFAVLDQVVYAVGGYSDDYLSLSVAFEPLPFRIFIPATER